MVLIAIVILVVVVIVVLILLGYFISLYNSLVMLSKNIDKAWSNIDVMLKQRLDELTKLMASVKGYMKFEKAVLTDVTRARTAFMDAKTVKEKAKADNIMSGTLKTLFAVAENYPTLKANENFIQFQARISDLENQIADRREFYNDSVNTFNIRIHQIPANFFANMLHYIDRELFKAAEEEKKDVKVEF